MEFANRFNGLMQEKGITAYRLSQETGIPQSMIGRWRQGRQTPTVEKVLLIARYFGVTTDYLLGNNYFYYLQKRKFRVRHRNTGQPSERRIHT